VCRFVIKVADLRVRKSFNCRSSSPICRSGADLAPLDGKRVRLVGTYRKRLVAKKQGRPATDQFITIHGLHYLELSDGSVRRARGFFDLYDAATQLGLLPARGGMGEAALLLLRGFGVRRKT